MLRADAGPAASAMASRHRRAGVVFTGSSSGDLGDGQHCAQIDPAFDKIPDRIFRIHDPFPVWLDSARGPLPARARAGGG